MEIPYSELKLPANVEDTDRLFDANAMDLYRGIAQGPLAVDLYANAAPYGDFNESMFAEAPAYNGKFDKSSDDALTVLVAPKLIVEAEDSLELPIYDSTDLFPLESTHLRVDIQSNDSLSKEILANKHAVSEIFETAIRNYLQEHQQTIKYQIEEACMLGINKSPKAGFFKCTTGLLNSDLSCGADYVCFVIQVYREVGGSHIIVEWQRRRGNIKTFRGLFSHFQTVIMNYLLNTKAAIVPNQSSGYFLDALNSAEKAITSRKSRRNSPILNGSDMISPVGHSELFKG